MRRVSRHIERYNALLLVELLEVGRIVALVAVEDQEPVGTLCTTFCMEIEVFYPF